MSYLERLKQLETEVNPKAQVGDITDKVSRKVANTDSSSERSAETAPSLGFLKYNQLRDCLKSLESKLPTDFYLLLEQNEKAYNAYFDLEGKVHKACWSREVGIAEFNVLLIKLQEFHLEALEGFKQCCEVT